MTFPSIEGSLRVKSEVGIILPTYCEVGNISRLVDEIENLNLNLSILLIDDSSPDGTADAFRNLQKKHNNLLLYSRTEKAGLGTAITDGFKIFLSLKNHPEYIVTMDTDFSHSPKDIPRLLCSAKKMQGLVIGSRYCAGGNAVNWGVPRKIISRVANLLASVIVNAGIKDYTSGLRCYSTTLVKSIVNDLHSETYEIQLETIRQARFKKFDIAEMPVLFVSRKKGKSKLSINEVREYLSYILKIGFGRKPR